MKKNNLKSALAEKPMHSIPRKSAEIKKAMNGFVISSWHEDGEKLYIAKTEKEAQEYAAKCLSMK
jgi:hypothetical protein